MITNACRNQTTHTEFTFEDGEIVTEARKATLGGWVNMAARLEARFGGRLRMDIDGEGGTLNGRRFTCQTVSAL